MNEGFHLSLGRGIGLYLNIALVRLERSLRRMFLRMYMLINVNDMYMMNILMTLRDVGYPYEYVFGLYC